MFISLLKTIIYVSEQFVINKIVYGLLACKLYRITLIRLDLHYISFKKTLLILNQFKDPNIYQITTFISFKKLNYYRYNLSNLLPKCTKHSQCRRQFNEFYIQLNA